MKLSLLLVTALAVPAGAGGHTRRAARPSELYPSIAGSSPVTPLADIKIPALSLIDELGPVRRGEIESRARDWTAIRDQGLLDLARFPERVAAGGLGYRASDIRRVTMKVRDLLEQVKRVEIKVNELLHEKVRARLPSTERDAADAAVDDLFRSRMLTLYGNMLPRIFDEAIEDPRTRQAIGRRFVPGWKLELTETEGQAHNRWLYKLIGTTPEEMASIGARARSELGLPPAKP